MSARMLRMACMATILLASTAGVAAERIALVIGNGQYASAPLSNPVNDARLIRDTLQGLEFKVRYVENADRGAMVRSIQAMGRDLTAAGGDSVGLFYFSGHGAQSEGRNYLLPVGGQIESEADLLPEAVDADWVLKQMEQAGNPLNILILDACRNNTMAVASKSAAKGLARMVAPVGSVLAYATDAGTVAYNGKGANSPYASALARYMKEPGLELKAMFDQVAQSVYSDTRSESVPQVPVQLYKLAPSFYFKGAPPNAQHAQPQAGTPQKELLITTLPGDALKIGIASNVSFDINSAQIRPEAMGIYFQIANVLKTYPRTVVHIIGHTDAAEHGQNLSETRASAVASFMISQGLPAWRVREEGRGTREPLVHAGGDMKEARNRRVDIIVKPVIEGREAEAWTPPAPLGN